jgi:hypothetical protein
MGIRFNLNVASRCNTLLSHRIDSIAGARNFHYVKFYSPHKGDKNKIAFSLFNTKGKQWSEGIKLIRAPAENAYLFSCKRLVVDFKLIGQFVPFVYDKRSDKFVGDLRIKKFVGRLVSSS